MSVVHLEDIFSSLYGSSETSELPPIPTGDVSSPRSFSIKLFLCFVHDQIRTSGWMPRGRASASRPATADRALLSMRLRLGSGSEQELEGSFPPSTLQMVEEALSWGRSLAGDDALPDYLFSLGEVSLGSRITEKQAGLAASLLPSYEKAARKQMETRRNLGASRWMGEEGERIERTMRVIDRIVQRTKFGDRQLYKLESVDGDQAAWFTDKEAVEVGKSYVVKATVKKQDLRDNGLRVTLLTRLVILEGA